MDLTPGPEPICGEAGTYWLKGRDEPHFTAPCELAAFHEDPHDWAQHESAIHEEGYRAGREEAARDIDWRLMEHEAEASEAYARRKVMGVEDQAKELAIRSRTWKAAREAAAEAMRGGSDG